MKAFHCDGCGSLVFFENVQCLNCGLALGFLPDVSDLSALQPGKNGDLMALTPLAVGREFRPCANGQQHGICNWLVAAEDPNPFCISCRLNQVVPDLSVPDNLQRWHKLELAKRRIIYTLVNLDLPTNGESSHHGFPLHFSFLGDPPAGPPVVTGHSDGLITINIAEADDDERERRRVNLHEPYRTLVGHIRHEIAHFYWDRLIADGPRLERFRSMFGDETLDYPKALQAYYQQGPPPKWQDRFVSAYASAHPWEDWAETGAHYLHMMDTLETAAEFRVAPSPKPISQRTIPANPKSPDELTFDQLIESWIPLIYTLNALNRGMGLPDLYPYVLTDVPIEKLRFVHQVIQESAGRQTHAGQLAANNLR